MKRVILKILVSIITFVATLVIFGKVMNRGNTNTTRDMDRASLPVIYMNIGGSYVNELWGYTAQMDEALLRENITPLEENRGVSFRVVKYGQLISRITVKVRSLDGSRLIESIDLTDYSEDDYGIAATVFLKDLLENNKEYNLEINLLLADETTAMYHTRIIKADSYCAKEKLSFVKEFLELEGSEESNVALKTYMESNYLGDNTTLATVGIHSSMKQLAYGDLSVKRVCEPNISIKEIAPETAVIVADYIVSTENDKKLERYYVEEYFRIKYSNEITYLLDYNRTMDKMPDEECDLINSGEIYLGICNEENVLLAESDDANMLALSVGNKLYSYNISQNRLYRLFSFYDNSNFDTRTYRNNHTIKPLTIDEAGNAWFVVYGYMNRGTYEGRVGFTLYYYNGITGVIEEQFFVGSDKSYEMVQRDLDELSYLSRDGIFYYMLDNTIYAVDTATKKIEVMVKDLEENSYTVSANSTMMVWIDGEDVNSSECLYLMNLNTKQISTISAPKGQLIKPIAFMNEDFVYGLANKEDLLRDGTGRVTFPMYVIKIENKYGEVLKEYRNEDSYVSQVDTEGNLLTLYRVKKANSEELKYTNIDSDYITNNQESEELQNRVIEYNNGYYEKVHCIAFKKNQKNKMVLVKPSEVIYEGNNELEIPKTETELKYYYTYYGGKLQGVFTNPANAVNSANKNYGTVVNESGNYVWYRANRSLRNQIMDLTKDADKSDEPKTSLVFCLDNIMEYEGVVRSSELLLERGETVLAILEDALSECDVMDLTGCELDSMLYYLNRDIPVLALMNDGNSYMLIGYNSLSLVVCEPKKGSYKIGLNEAEKMFSENGNRFITYVK